MTNMKRLEHIVNELPEAERVRAPLPFGPKVRAVGYRFHRPTTASGTPRSS